jgi:hypothetical protein
MSGFKKKSLTLSNKLISDAPSISGDLSISARNGKIIAYNGIIDSQVVYTSELANISGSLVKKTGDLMSGTLVMSGAGIRIATPTAPLWTEGMIFYDEAQHTLAYYNDNPEVTVNVGQEQLIRVRNQTGSTISNGKAVYISGSSGSHPLISLADNDNTNSHSVIGVATHDINDNENGYITVNGKVNGLNTNGYSAAGVMLWLGEDGNLTELEPIAPEHKVKIGYVIRKHTNEGSILVNIDNGLDLSDIHDVSISGANIGDVLSYNGLTWGNNYNINNYTSNITTSAISAGLQSQLNSINIVAGSNVTVVQNPSKTWTISSTSTGGGSGFTPIAGNGMTITAPTTSSYLFSVDDYISKTNVSSVSAGLQNQFNLFSISGASSFTPRNNNGYPTTGTWPKGSYVVDSSGTPWVCISGGSPGAWATILTDVYNVKNYGAVGDFVNNDTSAIEAAINAASAKATATGTIQKVLIPNGRYGISSSIDLASNIIIEGEGTIERLDSSTATGALYALMRGQNLSNIHIRGITIKGVGPDRKIAGSCTDATTYGGQDSAIELRTCTDFSIVDVKAIRCHDAIRIVSCNRGLIDSNTVNSQSSKTLASLDDGSFVSYSFGTSRGSAIQIAGFSGATQFASTDDVIVTNNIIECVGLDQGIDVGTGSRYPFRMIVSNNSIAGTNCGIQTYVTTAVPDDGNATTTNRGVLISANRVRLTYEQGIYVRGVAGVSVIGNYVERCCIAGIGPSGGGAGGGIVCREPTSDTYGVSPLADDSGIHVTGNSVVDCGNPITGTCESGIRCELRWSMVSNNIVSRSVDRFGSNLLPASNCVGIQLLKIGNNQPKSLEVANNYIYGFSIGIYHSWSTPYVVTNMASARFLNNNIRNTSYGIRTEPATNGIDIANNIITDCTITGIRVRTAPFAKIVGNRIDGPSVGIEIASGCLANTHYGSTARAGATLTITDNLIYNVNTPVNLVETSGVDSTLYNRCAIYNGNYVDGIRHNGVDVNGAPSTKGGNVRSWNLGDEALNTSLSSTNYIAGWRCVQAGTNTTAYTLSSITANTTASSTYINFNSIEGIVPGVYITIAGVTGVKRVVTLSGLNGTIDSTASASVVAGTVAYSAPIFDVLNMPGVYVNSINNLFNTYTNSTTTAAISAGLDTRLVGVENINTTQTNSINNLFNTYTNSTTTSNISAGLQSQINSINIVAGSNVTVVQNPSKTWTISSTSTGSSGSADALIKTNNLRDLTNPLIAQSNIGIDSFTNATSGDPISGNDYNILPTDKFIGVGPITQTRNLYLPPANWTNAGHEITIADISAGCSFSRMIKIHPSGGDTIDGANAYIDIYAMYGSVKLTSNGVNGWISSNYTKIPTEYGQIGARRDLVGFENDFVIGVSPLATGIASAGWNLQQSGTNANVTVNTSGGDSFNNGMYRSGILDFNSGTTAAGRIRLVQSESMLLYFGIGPASAYFTCYTPSPMDGTIHDAIFQIGFTDSAVSGTTPGQAACFLYERTTSANYWIALTADNSNRTKTILDGTNGTIEFPFVAESTMGDLGIDINTNGTEVRFYRNGQLLAINTTNIPTNSSRRVGFKAGFWRIAGTSNAIYLKLDRAGFQFASTAPRG